MTFRIEGATATLDTLSLGARESLSSEPMFWCFIHRRQPRASQPASQLSGRDDRFLAITNLHADTTNY